MDGRLTIGGDDTREPFDPVRWLNNRPVWLRWALLTVLVAVMAYGLWVRL